MMMRTLEIPRERWERAMESLARRLGERPISVEVIGRPLGDQELGNRLPFRGLDYDAKGSERGSLTVMAGTDAASFEHRIVDPTAVYLAIDDAGEIAWLAVEEKGDEGVARTLIHFEPLPALSAELEERSAPPA
jgi:hypothetical protein